MSKLELGIAWRYLRGHGGSRLLSFITIIAIGGVVIGVGALIVVMGVMNGLQQDLREKILIGSPDVRVLSFGEDLKIADWRSMLGRIRTERGVVAAAPFVLTNGLVRAGHGAEDGSYIAGIEPLREGRVDPTSIRQRAVEGDFTFKSPSDSLPGAVVGDLLAKRLGAVMGDTLTVLTIGRGAVNAATGTVVPFEARFLVTGLFKTGMFEYDNAYVFVSLSAGQAVAGLDSAVTGIEVSTTDRWIAPDVARRLADSLGYPYRTVDWQEQNSTLFQALKLQKLAMTVILLLIALVAAFTIISNLTMVVADKTREIGILRAMGMTSRSIGRVFFAQGLIIGLVGTVLGLALGLLVSAILGKYELVKLDPSIYFIDHLPVANQVSDVLLTVLASVVIAALATLSPARAAAKLYPVEAIRHE